MVAGEDVTYASMRPAHANSGNFALGARRPGDEPAALRKPIAIRNSTSNTLVFWGAPAPANAQKSRHCWCKGD